MAARNQAGKNQTKDLKCATHLLSEKFRNMSEEKKMIVRNLGFGDLMHIPPLRVHHQLLRELANNFKLGENRLETGYGSFKIRPKTIGDALGINASGDLFPQKVNYKDLYEDDKEIFRRFQGKTLKNLTDEMMDIGVDKKRAERPPKPWIANWSKEQLVERMRAEIKENMSETQEDSEDSPRKEPSKKGKKSEIRSEDLDDLLRKNNENSAAQGEKEADLRSTEGHYVSSETIPDVNLGSDDPSSQGHTEQSSVNRPAESMLSLVEESAIEPADSNMMVVREETPSEGLPINPAPEDAAALMMMAWTASVQAQDIYTLSKFHLASLAPKTHIEVENMALANHPEGVFLQPKNNKPFRVEDYPMFIPFLDLQKLKSHRYIFTPVCHSFHWWLWIADTRKRKFYIVDPLHNKSPSDARTVLNTFVDEVDHFRVEYASRILFHDMNLDKDEAIRGSNAIRLSKPSLLLLSSYCQIDSQDVDTA
ncbi:uncharacterized protein DS421_11g325320 [Arachis hypogaea]|nr:uncharacterized protein DS421_11g325320 [Arachis hypogaea]